jgi:2-dehydro-3-deoxyphosphogalactonate aldolase
VTLDDHLGRGAPPIIAILRGISPDEAVNIGQALIDAGLRLIEVPLNSPQPLLSIERLVVTAGGRALIGAGTVTSVAQVDQVFATGGRMIVAPNSDAAVIARAMERELDVLPGAMSPTEAFAACAAGARHIKMFPSSSLGPAHVRALREVLPSTSNLWAVGGTSAANLEQWLNAGAIGIGVGSSLYRPGTSSEAVFAVASELVAAWHRAQP